MGVAPTPQQSLAMAYARLRAVRDDIVTTEAYALEGLCADFTHVLDDLQTAGFDLSAFKLDGGDRVEDRDGSMRVPSSVLGARLDAVLVYLDLLAGLP
jgi:hypothetical protein